MKYICIYCKEHKEGERFNAEHVIPQSLGLFDNTPTLNNTVCTDCNQYFGDGIELILARDSAFLLERFYAGLINHKKFKQSMRFARKNLDFFVVDQVWGKIHINLELSETCDSIIHYANQVIILNSTKGKAKIYRLKYLPFEQQLDSIGLSSKNDFLKVILSLHSNEDTVKLEFKKKGFSQVCIDNMTEKLLNKEQPLVVCESRISSSVLKVVAKIAFNYLVYKIGGEYAISDEFDSVREYIKSSEETSPSPVKVISNHGIHYNIKELKKNSRREHSIKLYCANDGLIRSNIKLFNRLEFEVALASYSIYFPSIQDAFIINLKSHSSI